MTKDNGGAAFPFSPSDQSTSHMATNGMSLRDWFAGQAMTAFYSSFDQREGRTSLNDLRADAWLFFEIADAMLAARICAALTTGENDD